MARTVSEWIGKTDDSAIPPRVRVRIFDRSNGLCHVCGCKIDAGTKWHADHVIALIEGGENRETNLKPAHEKCNLEKANEEKARKSKVAKTRKKHIGAVKPAGNIKSQGFAKADKPQRQRKQPLPPRQLYVAD